MNQGSPTFIEHLEQRDSGAPWAPMNLKNTRSQRPRNRKNQVFARSIPTKCDSRETDPIVSYAAGICWTTASFTGEAVLIRNKDREKLHPLSVVTGKQPFRLRNRKTWCIKLAPSHPFVVYLFRIGWEGRKNKERGMPNGDVDLQAWTKGYCSVMAHIKSGRIRIYGSRLIMEGLNGMLGKYVGVKPKKIYDVHTNTGQTCELSYGAAGEINSLARWLSLRPEYLDRN